MIIIKHWIQILPLITAWSWLMKKLDTALGTHGSYTHLIDPWVRNSKHSAKSGWLYSNMSSGLVEEYQKDYRHQG